MIPKTVMLIDQPSDQLHRLEKQITGRGYQTLNCNDLQEALKKSNHFQADIAFIGLDSFGNKHLPYFYKLKNQLPNLITILIVPSSHSLEDIVLPAEDIDNYIITPFQPEVVEITLRQSNTLIRRREDAQRQVTELQSQQTFFQHLLNAFPEAIVVVDEQLAIHYCNDGFENLVDQPADVLTGQSLYDYLEDGYKILYHIREQLRTHTSIDGYMVTVKNNGADGIAANLGASLLPLNAEGNRQILIKIEHYSLTQERFMRSVRKEKLSTIQYLSIALAHEIQNPMNILSGRLQLLEQQYHEDESARSFSIINQQMERISGIIGQLRKFNLNKSDTIPESFQLIPFLEKCLKEFKGDSRTKYKLHYLPEYSRIMIYGNRAQIRDAFAYLLRTVNKLVSPSAKVVIDCQLLNTPTQPPQLEVQIDLPKTNIPETLLKDFNSLDFEPNDQYSVLDIALLHSILTNYGGEVSIASRSNQQTRIRMLFRVTGSPNAVEGK